MTLDQLNAIKRFKQNLEICFDNKKRGSQNETEKNILDYVLKTINLHYELSDVEWQASGLQQEIDQA